MLLEAIKLNKSYERNRVIQDASISIDKGDSVCIIGENGSGKSTLLKIFCGLIKPDKGILKILNADPFKHPDNLIIKQRIGVLLHSNMLYPVLTLKENLTFFSKLLGIVDFKTNVDKVASKLNLEKFLNTEVYKLSNGNQRKAGFAKSILNDPEILITDEPEANIDHQSTEIFSLIFKERSQRLKANVFTSHSESFYNSCSNKKLGLSSGRLSPL